MFVPFTGLCLCRIIYIRDLPEHRLCCKKYLNFYAVLNVFSRKTPSFLRRFSYHSRRGGNLPPAETHKRFSFIHRALRGYNRGVAAPASFRKEGDRREAVVEDSLTAQAVLKSVPKAPE